MLQNPPSPVPAPLALQTPAKGLRRPQRRRRGNLGGGSGRGCSVADERGNVERDKETEYLNRMRQFLQEKLESDGPGDAVVRRHELEEIALTFGLDGRRAYYQRTLAHEPIAPVKRWSKNPRFLG
jgi:hypothetical protein